MSVEAWAAALGAVAKAGAVDRRCAQVRVVWGDGVHDGVLGQGGGAGVDGG